MEWEVNIYEIVRHKTIVEANNRDEAYDKAYDIIGNGSDGEYETRAEGFTGDWDATEASMTDWRSDA